MKTANSLGPSLMGTGNSFPGVKRTQCEADHSHPSSAEVVNARIYASISNTSSWHGN